MSQSEVCFQHRVCSPHCVAACVMDVLYFVCFSATKGTCKGARAGPTRPGPWARWIRMGAVPAHLLRARVVPRHLGAAAGADVPALDGVAFSIEGGFLELPALPAPGQLDAWDDYYLGQFSTCNTSTIGNLLGGPCARCSRDSCMCLYDNNPEYAKCHYTPDRAQGGLPGAGGRSGSRQGYQATCCAGSICQPDGRCV